MLNKWSLAMPTIKVPDTTMSDIKSIADDIGRSPHWVMLEAIKKYVKEKKQAAEAEKSWLESGVDALNKAEKEGYACSATELKTKIQHLKETAWVSKT